ncbi:MAG: BON domain-containing protein [Actinomycetota bacterium]|nr:BON domain-containing protein [Actinomycetota bacterium]
MKRIRTFIAGTAAGAGFAYFWDPDRGKVRRDTALDQLRAVLGRSGRRMPDEVYVEDTRLKDRIESGVFSSHDLPKGQVNVTVVDGVAELRGQLQTPEDINRLVRGVERVPGVVDVRSMLHLPGTPAPNKREAREAAG